MFRLTSFAFRGVSSCRFAVLPVLMSLLATSSPAQAAIVTNFSFESPATSFYTPGAITGWTLSNPANQGVFRPSHDPGLYYTGTGTTDGLQTAYLNGGSISQILSETLVANVLYMLQVDVGDRKDTAFPGYHVQLLAGSTILANGSSLTPNDGFLTSTVLYTATAADPHLGEALQIRLISNGQQVNFDNVRLTAIPLDVAGVPEPATGIIWMLGLIGTACWRTRRRGIIPVVR